MKRKINCLIPEALGEQLDSHFDQDMWKLKQ
jgi:hypothetical protein